MPKHQSGAAKRKKKEEAKKGRNKLPKLDSFFQQSTAGSTPPVPSTSLLSLEAEDDTETEQVTEGDKVETKSSEQVVENVDLNHSAISMQGNVYLSDKFNFPDPLTIENKRFIIENGPCQPVGPFQKNEEGRSFNIYYYKKITKTGMTISRNWLCYSIKLNVAYCEPCWLFNKNFKNESWITGFGDWRHISQSIVRHETSAAHFQSCQTMVLWKRNDLIDKDLEETTQKDISMWVQILDRIINVTLTLATSNLAFRGHFDSLNAEVSSGNFLNIIKLLAKYDPILNNLISDESRKIKYLSPQIQNEIITLLGNEVKKKYYKGY